MKKKLLSLALLTLVVHTVSAQDHHQLDEYFRAEQQKKEEIFTQLQGKSTAVQAVGDVNKLADISEDYAWFLQAEDIRANKASNVDNLQNGDVAGFQLNGEAMEIAIFDGGKVRDTHREFRISAQDTGSRIIDLENGAQALSAHSTNVAGFIAAEGIGNGGGVVGVSKGVLPKAVIKHAGFATTSNGALFNKILNYGELISNHSYGVNSGWSYKTPSADGVAVAGWYFPNNPSSMTSSDQSFFGAYQANDYNYDLIVNNYPQMTIVKSSGNYYGDGPGATNTLPLFKYTNSGYVPFAEGDVIPSTNCVNGAYCIGTGSLAKNIIVVGAVNLPASSTGYKITNKDQIIRSSYSSVGPRKDGAIKPDLVAVGTNVYAPSSSGDTSLSSGSGTSFSAPKVTGVVGALTELKRLLTQDAAYYFYADEVKALLTHTAMEAGEFDGPDNWFGWGMLDGLKAAQLVLAAHNQEEFFERNEKVSGEDFEKIVSAREGEELKVTITWLDPSGTITSGANNILTNTDSKLVNDLDLRVIDTVTQEVYLPWKLDLTNVTGAAVKGDNVVDNIEQIVVKNPIAGRNYKIQVTNKGTLLNQSKNPANQKFTLLTTGASEEVLATTDVTANNTISVYPTVAKDVVTVRSTQKVNQVEVYDLTGRKVLSSTKEQFNVSGLSSGVYVVHIQTASGVSTKKIVKQ